MYVEMHSMPADGTPTVINNNPRRAILVGRERGGRVSELETFLNDFGYRLDFISSRAASERT